MNFVIGIYVPLSIVTWIPAEKNCRLKVPATVFSNGYGIPRGG